MVHEFHDNGTRKVPTDKTLSSVLGMHSEADLFAKSPAYRLSYLQGMTALAVQDGYLSGFRLNQDADGHAYFDCPSDISSNSWKQVSLADIPFLEECTLVRFFYSPNRGVTSYENQFHFPSRTNVVIRD